MQTNKSNRRGRTTKRVLIVEDEPIIAYDLISEIKADGHDVVGQCSTAQKAVSLAQTLKPDLIIMDIGLLGTQTGLEAAREIKTRLGIGSIFVSATLDRVDPNVWNDIEPVALIRKPYGDEALLKAIRGY